MSSRSTHSSQESREEGCSSSHKRRGRLVKRSFNTYTYLKPIIICKPPPDSRKSAPERLPENDPDADCSYCILSQH